MVSDLQARQLCFSCARVIAAADPVVACSDAPVIAFSQEYSGAFRNGGVGSTCTPTQPLSGAKAPMPAGFGAWHWPIRRRASTAMAMPSMLLKSVSFDPTRTLCPKLHTVLALDASCCSELAHSTFFGSKRFVSLELTTEVSDMVSRFSRKSARSWRTGRRVAPQLSPRASTQRSYSVDHLLVRCPHQVEQRHVETKPGTAVK